MKISNGTNSSILVITLSFCAVAVAAAWSCGPSSSYYGVIGNRYRVGCRPDEENCGPSSSPDFLTLPEIETMLRRSRNMQKKFSRPFIDEFRFLDSPFGTSTIPQRKTRSARTRSTVSHPRYDITETDNNIQIALDVPGIDMKDISIALDDQTKVLTVSGSRTTSRNAADDDTVAQPNEISDTPNTIADEWSQQMSSRTFVQKFVLKNPTIDINQIAADLENGVLTITLPKKIPPTVKENNVRQIPIMTSSSSSTTTTKTTSTPISTAVDPSADTSVVAFSDNNASDQVASSSSAQNTDGENLGDVTGPDTDDTVDTSTTDRADNE